MNQQDCETVDAMEKWGGGFCKCLAACFRHADSVNFIKLKITFSEYWLEYQKIAEQQKKTK